MRGGEQGGGGCGHQEGGGEEGPAVLPGWRCTGRGRGAGCSEAGGWSGVAEPIEEVIQVVHSLHTLPLCAGLCFVACEGSDALPDLPHVVLPQLLLHFLPVGVFCLLQAAFHLPLCCFHLLLVFIPEGPFLLVEESLDSLWYPWVVIEVTLNCLGGGHHVYTEVKLLCETVSHPLDVLIMCTQEHIPVRGVVAVSQGLLCFRSPSPDGASSDSPTV